ADAFLASWDGRLQPLLSHAQNAYILQHWVRTRCGITLSHSAQRDLLRRLRSDKPQWTQPLDDRWQLKKEYARVVLDTLEMCGFSYTYDTLRYVQTDHFSLCPQGERIEGVTLKESDFPITIRNARSGDAIVLRFGTKKLSRWFIDRHIPQDVRRRWPVMVNAQGTVIFVPKIGCDITHFSNNPNVFMIQ
ncbi:MAG: tRNA lysidine(34) synthetase TilS, partial [Merdibacter sp.]